MKISLDEYGCCLSTECKFRRECAQHSSAGDFRSEDGFAPEFSETDCQTADQPTFEETEFGIFPRNVNSLGSGFLSLKELKARAQDYQI